MRAVILAAVVLAAACSSSIPMPTAEHATRASARWPGTTRETLVAGRDMYVARCSGCHTLYPPSVHSPEEWREVVAEMSERARLTPPDADLVLKYLETLAGK